MHEWHYSPLPLYCGCTQTAWHATFLADSVMQTIDVILFIGVFLALVLPVVKTLLCVATCGCLCRRRKSSKPATAAAAATVATTGAKATTKCEVPGISRRPLCT